jgi:hypothetical protein
MPLPYLFLDVDGVLHGTRMKYGYEQETVVTERLARDLVHPSMRPDRYDNLPPHVRARRRPPTHVTFRTHVRTSPVLRDDLAALPVQTLMLTTWLEHSSVDAFLAQTPGPQLPERRNLPFPGRDTDGALPYAWKFDMLRARLEADPRPFIWVDDEAATEFREDVERFFSDVPHLLIAPNYDIGLTPNHIAQMREFLSAL